MRVLIYSRSFHPAVGGIETISATLAENLQSLGVDPTVVTNVPYSGTNPYSFPVVRCPTFRKQLRLIQSVDVVHSNGPSLNFFLIPTIARKPVVWTHNGYQVSCIDGLGWSGDGPTPLTPIASFLHHFRRTGAVYACKGFLKLLARRFVARHFVHNVAATRWMETSQPMPRQTMIYNPFPLNRFAANESADAYTFDFVFLGRLVSEKGVETLIEALSKVRQRPGTNHCTLAIVGDGPLRYSLSQQVKSLDLEQAVTFLGALQGDALVGAVKMATVGIVPSIYNEPMGGVALELLAAGRPVIVSQNGGIAECVGAAGLTFTNGNSHDLAEKMETMLLSPGVKQLCLLHAPTIVEAFDPMKLSLNYANLYRSLVQTPKQQTQH